MMGRLGIAFISLCVLSQVSDNSTAAFIQWHWENEEAVTEKLREIELCLVPGGLLMSLYLNVNL